MGTRNAVKPLSEAVERRLVKRLAAGDRAARRRLIEAYLGMVFAIARRYAARSGVALEDLIQEGALALVRVVDHYDPDRGMQLSTYVTWWVKQAIRRAAMAQGTPVRVPERVWERAGELSRTEQSLRQRLEREVGDPDLTGALGWSKDELEEVRLALRPVVSLEAPVAEETGDGLGDLVPDPGTEDPAEAAARRDARQRLAQALTALPVRERTILSGRAGFEGEPQTLTGIGRKFGISRERVRQLERAALAELRDRREELGLEGLAA